MQKVFTCPKCGVEYKAESTRDSASLCFACQGEERRLQRTLSIPDLIGLQILVWCLRILFVVALLGVFRSGLSALFGCLMILGFSELLAILGRIAVDVARIRSTVYRTDIEVESR